MDLVKIGFQINANGLKDANKQVDDLLSKVDKIGTQGKKSAADFETSQKKVKESSKEATKEVDKTSKALEKQKIIGDYLGKGLDKTTATSVANFKQLGGTVEQTNDLLSILGNQKALIQVKKDADALTKAQEQHRKVVEQTIGKYEALSGKSFGNGILDSIEKENKGLSELRKHYEAVQKEREKQLAIVKKYDILSSKSFGGGILDTVDKQTKGLQDMKKYYQALEKSDLKAADAIVAARNKELAAEKRVNDERQKAILLEQTKQKYINQGFGKGASTQLAKMEIGGADVGTLNRYQQALTNTGAALGSLGNSSSIAAEKQSKLLQQIKGIAFYAVLSTAIYGVVTAISALTTAFVSMADEYTAIQNRMKLYIKDAGELGRVNAQLAQMSIENNVGLRETATLFSRLLPAMQKIGANTAAVTSVVDAFGKSMRIGGATAQEAASATIQFSQAMASGKLAGDEFRAISEASPRFLKAIAEGSKKAASELKAMSSAGLLTTEVVAKALLDQYPKLIEENKKLGVTLEQGANAIKTGFLVAIGEFNEGAKVTQYFGEMMIDLAKNMFEAAQGAREFGQDVKQWFTDNANTINLVIEAFKVLATVIIARYVVAMGLAVRESIRYQATLVTMAAQQANVTRSSLIMSSAITSVGAAMRGALAFFGGWVGLALTVASATAAYLSFNSASGATAESFRQEGESLTATIDKYKELAKVKQQAVLDKEIANLEELNKQYDENKAKLVTNVLNLSRHNDMTQAQSKSMSDLALAYKNGDISLEQLVSTVSKSGYVSNDSKVKTRSFAEAVIDAGEKAGVSKDLINAMRKALADSGEAAKISKTGVDTFTKGLEDQAKKLREITALAKKYGLEIASAAKLQEQLASRFGARETELPLKKQYYDKKAQEAMSRGDTATANNWTKASLAIQSQQNSLLKEKNQLISGSVKGLKEVELAQKEQSDYTEALRKAEKDADKTENKREKDRKKYQDQAKELSAYITLLEEAQDVDVARIASEKEYQNAFGASLDQAKALYELRRQAEQVEARAVFVKNLAEEEEAQGRLVALMKAGLDIATARTLVEAKFTDNAKGKEAAEKYLTNMAYEQHYALADQIDSQGVMNNLLKQGYTIEQASFRLMTSRIRTLNGDSTYLDDLDKAYDAQVKQLKAKQAESSVLQETDKLEKQKVAYINAQAAGYEKLALNMAIANKIAQNPDLSPSQARRLVEAEELANYEKELADLKAKTYIASLKESDAVKDIIGNYTSLDSVQVGTLDRQRKILDVAKGLSDEAEKQRKNPLGDFSSVGFNVFGDFGNPFESALAGLNEFVAKSTESRNILDSIEKDIVAAKEKGLSVTDLEFERNLVLAGQEKDRKDAINKGITKTLALTKGLFSEESKGYKLISKLEQAYQASQVAFQVWKNREKIKEFALEIAGHVKTAASYVAATATKIAAEGGLNIAKGIGAVLSQGQGDPYTAFARMAAMAAVVVGLGVAISNASGSSGTVTPSNNGTGTVFGDSTAQSESIKKSIDLLADNSDLMLPINNAMLRALKNIESALGGVANLIIRGDIGNSFASNLEYGGKLTGIVGKLQSVSSKVASAFNFLDKFTGLGMGGLFNGIRDTILGGLFGKKSQSITGSGLFAGSQSLGSVLDTGLNLKQYADVATTKKSWFSKSTSYSTQYGAVDQEIKNQFGLIFDGVFNSILTASRALGKDGNEVTQALRNSIINIGKIDTRGLTGEEIQKKLEAVISAQADTVAKNAVKGLDAFQKIGEGYFETLTRVAIGIEQAAYYTDQLGYTAIQYTDIIAKQGDVASEIIRQSVLLNESTKAIKGGFYDMVNQFDGTAEELYSFIIELRDLQDQLFMTGKDTKYLTTAMVLGAGGLEVLSSGLDAYFEMLSPAEQAAELTRRLTNEFSLLGKQLPSDVKAYRDLVNSIDVSTEAGQKLYGQIIALAPEFNDLQDSLDKANSEVNALVKSLRDLADEARKARGETEQPRNLAYVRNQFQNDSILAMQGDTAAAERLLTLGKDLMSLSKQYSVSGSEYAKDLALIQRAATVSADVQEAGLGYTPSTILSTAIVSGNTASVVQALEQKNATLEAEIKSMREDTNAGLLAIAKFTQNMDSRFDRWDDGNRMIVGISSEQGDTPVAVAVTP